MLYRIGRDEAEFQQPSLNTFDIFKELQLSEEYFADCISLATTQKEFYPVWNKDVSCEFKRLPDHTTTAKIPHITLWNSTCLIMSDVAYNCLYSMLISSGEFLPLSVKGTRYYLFHTLKTISVNETETEYETTNEVITGLEKLVFNEEEKESQILFRAFPEEGYGGLFCNDVFKSKYEEFKLGGLVFEDNLANVYI